MCDDECSNLKYSYIINANHNRVTFDSWKAKEAKDLEQQCFIPYMQTNLKSDTFKPFTHFPSHTGSGKREHIEHDDK